MMLVVDAHNAVISPGDGDSRWLNALARFAQRRADLTLVSNDEIAKEVVRNGGMPFTLPDPLPTLLPVEAKLLGPGRSVLFICTFEYDEPYEEVFRAARLLPKDVTIFVTGDYSNASLGPADMPENVRLTGFLPEADYVAMLKAVDVVMDLTRLDHCLVCGAYEAVVCQKPMVLSDNKASREYFRGGAIHTRNTAPEIAKGVMAALERQPALAAEIALLRGRLRDDWASRKKALETVIDHWPARGPRRSLSCPGGPCAG
jgi:glycosyltransferase involved in cell wall biosynthesis